MSISELIDHLTTLLAEDGDLTVVLISDPEGNTARRLGDMPATDAEHGYPPFSIEMIEPGNHFERYLIPEDHTAWLADKPGSDIPLAPETAIRALCLWPGE
ncbi:hypothetical protein AB0I28_32805 [Phytomonospora sp. NPDC050363]|uniref:hypothetical protein n=1 Tax=Phytomonospora sp. NPDC050363 TaxID=3155642 RepID=UPI0034096542